MRLTRSRKIISGLALAGTLTLTGIVGFAQQQTTQEQNGQERSARQWGRGGDKGRHGMRGGGGDRLFGKLNLTDAQREQMKQIAARYHEGAKAKRQRGRERGGDMSVLNGGTFNEGAVRAAAQARANARVEMEVTRAHMMFEMYNVLTAEQKAQLAAAREQKRQEWRTRRGTRGAQTQ